MTKLEQLQELLKVQSDGLTRQDFESSFKTLIDFVKKLKEDNKEKMTEMDTRYDAIVNSIVLKLQTSSESELADAKRSVSDFCRKEMESMHETMEAKMGEVKNGKDADEETIIAKASELATQSATLNITPLIPTSEAILEQVENDLPQLGEKVRDSLELIQDEDEKLKIKAIGYLQEKLDELERKIRAISSGSGKTMYVPSGGGSGGHTMMVYDLSASLDGVTKTFSLPAFWRVISVQSSSFPNAFRPTVDYTTDGSLNTITFTSEIDAGGTLAAGQTVIVTYSI